MAFYTVTYDLNKVKDYEKIKMGIQTASSNRYVKVTLSQYVIQSSEKAGKIIDILRQYSDADDSIMVLKLDISDWSYINLPQNVGDWLNKATVVGN